MNKINDAGSSKPTKKKKPRFDNSEFRLVCEMDIESTSYSYVHTPGLWALQLPFYLESYGHYFADRGYFTEREGLKSFLLIYTLEGCGIVKSRDEEVFTVKNTAVLIDCMDYQYYKTSDNCRWEFMWVHLNGTAASTYSEIINSDGIALIDFMDDVTVKNHMSDIETTIKTNPMNLDLKFTEKLMSILTRMILTKQKHATKVRYLRHEEDINNAMDIIKAKYGEQLTIDELSQNAHISKFYFVRIFKDFTGQTPYEFLISYRINESKSLLLKTEMPISEVSARCGFEDTSNYIRCFKRATGTTPGAFRKDRIFLV